MANSELLNYIQEALGDPEATSPTNEYFRSVASARSNANSITGLSGTNPYAKDAIGIPLTDAEQEFIQDSKYLPSDLFDLKYGDGAYATALRGLNEANAYSVAKHSGQDASIFNFGDTSRNILAGAGSGLLSAGAYGASKLGLEDQAKDLAKASEDYSSFIDSFASYGQKAAREAFEYEKSIYDQESNRIYQEDLKRISQLPPELREQALEDAKLNRERRNYFDTVKSSFSSNQAPEAFGKGTGSIVSSAILTRSLGGVTKNIGGALATTASKPISASGKTLFNAANAYHLSKPSVQKALDKLSWMAAAGMQEAGGVLTENLSEEQLQEIINLPHGVLLENSDLYRHNYLEYKKAGMEPKDASFQAKKDLAFKIAEEAADSQFVVTAPLNIFTSGLAKPFTRGKKPLPTFIGESLSEVPEETAAEALGKYFYNQAKQEYADPNTDLLAGVGSAAGEGFVGGLGISATRAPGTVISTTISGAKAVSDALFDEDVDLTKKEKLVANINNITNSINKIRPQISQLESEDTNIVTVGNSLQGMMDELTDTATGDDGKVSETISTENVLNTLQRIQQYRDTVNNTEYQVDPNNKEAKTVSSKVEKIKQVELKVLDKLQNKANNILKKRANASKASWQEGQALSEDQLNTEANYLASLHEISADSFNARFNSLPAAVKTQITDGKFNNQFTQEKFDDIFVRKPEKLRETVTDIRDDVNIPAKKIDATNLSKNVTTLNVDGYPNAIVELRNPTESGGVSTLNYEGVDYELPNTVYEGVEHLKNTITDPEELNNSLNEFIFSQVGSIISAHEDSTDSAVESYTFTDSEGNQHKLKLHSTGLISIDGKLKSLPDELNEEIFNNAEAGIPNENTLKKIFYDGSRVNLQNTNTRAAHSLDPEVLAKENKVAIQNTDGSISIAEYDSEEKSSEFKNQYGKGENKKEGLPKIVKLMKRPAQLMLESDPIDFITKLLNNYDKLEEFLTSNNFTAARALLNYLFTDRDLGLNKNVDISTYYEAKGKLVDQVLSMLNPNGVFMKTFMANKHLFNKQEDDSKTIVEGLSNTFWNEKGEADERIVKILAIAAVQYMAKLHAYKHEMHETELKKFFIDLAKQSEEFTTADVVIEPLALQNLATTIRKMMGVAQANEASTRDMEKLFGSLAIKTMKVLKASDCVEVFEIDVNMVDANGEPTVVKYSTYRVTEDYKGMFKNKVDILEALFDPTWNNVWHTEPQPATDNIAHTDIRTTKAVTNAVKHANSMGASLNIRALKFIASLGGFDAFFDLMFGSLESQDSYLYNEKHLATLKGQQLTRKLAVDVLRELILGNKDKALEELKIFFKNEAIKNGRIMQRGSATYQANKVLRALLPYVNQKKIDISSQSATRTRWLKTLAQNLGIKVSNLQPSQYMKTVEDALDTITKIVNKPKYEKLLKSSDTATVLSLFDETKNPKDFVENQDLFSDLKEEFTNETLFDINDAQRFNALVEMIAYARAAKDPEALKNFESTISLEIDGRNDGPSYINIICGVAMSSFSGHLIRNAHKTGMYIGLKMNANQAFDSDSEEGKISGAGGTDFHGEVAKERVTEFFLARIVAFNKNPNGNKLPLKALKSLLTIFKGLGWIEDGDINKALSLTSMPDKSEYGNYLQFNRDVSKDLVTVIPYGSEVRGATQSSIINWMLPALYAEISAQIHKRMFGSQDPKRTLSEDFANDFNNGITYVIDTETTGIDPVTDAVVEVHVRKLNKGVDTGEELHLFIENTSGIPIPKTLKNGIPNPLLKVYNNSSKVTKDQAAKQIKDFIGSGTVIGHNLKEFDAPILANYLGVDFASDGNKLHDTLHLSYYLNSVLGIKGSHSLENIVAEETAKNKDNPRISYAADAHLASSDTQATAQLAKVMAEAVPTWVKEQGDVAQHSRRKTVNSKTEPNGIPFSSLMNAVQDLLTVSYDSKTGSFGTRESTEGLLRNWANRVFTPDEMVTHHPKETSKGKLYQPKDANTPVKDLRFFGVTQEGLKALTDISIPLFGEPAFAAVQEVIGNDGFLGSKIPTIISSILNLIYQSAEQLENAKNDGIDSLTKNKEYKLRKRLEKLAAIFELPGGQKVIVRKEKYVLEEEALITDSSGMKYYPSTTRTDSAGVSGSPLVIQATGDGTTIIKFLELLREQGYSDEEAADIVVGLVFDGVYVSPDIMEEMSVLLNKASAYATKQLIIGALVKRLKSVGNVLSNTKEYNLKSDNPYEAIKKALVRIATYRKLDGSALTDKDYSLDRDEEHPILRDLLDMLNKLEQNTGFIPNFDESRKARGRKYSTEFAQQANREEAVKNTVNDFFIKLQAIEINERLNHKALDSVPKSHHHMGGADSVYTEGVPLTVEQAKKLINKFKNKYCQTPGQEWPEIMAAYLNGKVSIDFEELDKKERAKRKGKDLEEWDAIVEAWKSITHRDKGNSGFVEMDKSEVSEIDNAFDEAWQEAADEAKAKGLPIPKRMEVFKASNTEKKHSVYGFGQIQEIFLDAKQNFENFDNPRLSRILSNLFGKIATLIEPNIQVRIYGSREALPKHIRAKFTNNSQTGLYLKTEGKPAEIYIIDAESSLDIYSPKNRERLIHEILHSVVSRYWIQYFDPNSNLRVREPLLYQAMENMVHLVDQLTEDKVDFGVNAPIQLKNLIQRLRALEDNSAEKYDEAMSYILSEAKLLNALANAKLKDPKESADASARFFKLVKDVVSAVKNAWEALFHIVTGSPISNQLDKDLEDFKNDTKNSILDFLSLYGTNTLVMLNETSKDLLDPDTKQVKWTKEKLKERALEDLEVSRYYSEIEEFRPFNSSNLTVAKNRYEQTKQGFKDYLKEVNKITTAFRARSKIFQKNLSTSFKTKHHIQDEIHRIHDYVSNLAQLLTPLVAAPVQAAQEAAVMLDASIISPSLKRDLTHLYTNFYENFDASKYKDPKKAEYIKKLLEPIKKSKVVSEDAIPKTFNINDEQAVIFAILWANDPETAQTVSGMKLSKKFQKPSLSLDLERNLEQWVLHLREKELEKTFDGKSYKQFVKSIKKEQELMPDSPLLKSVAMLDSVHAKVEKSLVDLLVFPLQVANSVRANAAENVLTTSVENRLNIRELILEWIRKQSNRHLPIWAVDLVKTIYGRLPSNARIQELLKELKGHIDRVRKANLDQIPEQLVKLFKHHTIDMKDRNFFDLTIGQMDVAALPLDVAKKCLTDRNALEKYIKEKELELRSWNESNIQNEDIVKLQIAKAKQLAEYFSGSRLAEHQLLKNQYAVADLPGTEYFRKASEQEILILDELITLYSMRFLTDAQINKFIDFYKTDEEGIEGILTQLKDYKQKEQEKKDFNDCRYMFFKNYRPEGAVPTGHYIIIPARLRDRYHSQGYDYKGKYVASNIDSSEPMITMYSPYPHHRELNEGVMQIATSTVFGFHVNEGSSVEANGTRITDPKALSNIIENYESESSGNGLIPLYTNNGGIRGFERSIPSEHRHYLEDTRDLFSGIAQGKTRQLRESFAKNITRKAIQAAWEDYREADEETRKKEFINVLDSDNPAIKKAVARFDKETKQLIKETFKSGGFYLRKDEVWTYTGYYRASITDAWDNEFIFPKPVEDFITKFIDLFVSNGRGRYYAGVIETNLIGLSSFARNTIVIRSGVVPLINAISNAFLLNFALGIPFHQILKLMKESFTDTEEYNKYLHKNIKLNFLIENLKVKIEDLKNKEDPNLQPEIIRLNKILADFEEEHLLNEKLIKSLPIYPLVEKGEYATISPEGMLSEDFDIYRQKAEDWVTGILDKTFKDGTKAKRWASNILMTRGSDTYGVMAKFTNYGDWLAKVIGYRFLTEGRYKGKTFLPTEARMIVSNLFVDYDQFNGREFDYLNRIGSTWFMTYKLRMLAAFSLSMAFNPVRMITGTILATTTGLGTPVSDNVMSKLIGGDLGYSLGMWNMWWRALSMHPLPATASMIL